MARPDKAAAVAELTDGFRNSTAVLLTEYRGLTVAQLKDLRRTLGEHVKYSVVKNTLTKIAAREASVEGLDDLLSGPSAIAFVGGDPVEAAKGLRDFSKANPLLVIKGGVMDGRSLTPEEIRKLADLESREVLLAKLAGAMKASLSGAVSLFAAPLAQTARLVEALRAKAEQDPTVLRGGAGTPVPAPVAEARGAESADAATTESDSAEAGADALTPEVQTLVAETPEVETPEVESQEVESQEVETPEAETPEAQTHEAAAPDATSAEAATKDEATVQAAADSATEA